MKQIVDITTGVIYGSAKQASQALGISYVYVIKHLNDKERYKTVKNHILEPYNNGNTITVDKTIFNQLLSEIRALNERLDKQTPNPLHDEIDWDKELFK